MDIKSKSFGQFYKNLWLANPHYVSSILNNREFDKYYQGMFNKSFSQVSNILNKSKFMVGLSEIPEDGGGRQYTFLEAIYNNCAIILSLSQNYLSINNDTAW